MDKQILKKLAEIVCEKAVVAEPDQMADYCHDELAMFQKMGTVPTQRDSLSGDSPHFLPDAVVKPQDAKQVSEILALANRENIPVTTRGGATGLCGGCVPVKGGIVLSLERMNKVLEIDKANKVAVVEAGLVLADFYKAVEGEGLFFPAHPGDESAQIGGIIATNAGGSRAVKYGTIRNYVRGLEVVLAGGEMIELGGKFSKNSSGYSILNLFIGSEGTLGVITKAIIGLIFPPAEMTTLFVPFSNLAGAIASVPTILESGILPMAVEFMENDIVEYVQKKLEYKLPCKNSPAYLLIILDASSRNELDNVCQKIADICFKNGADDVFVADSAARQKELLDFRSKFYEVLKPDMAEDLDLVVPVSEIIKLVEFVHKLQDKYGIQLITYGHAGDGNVHVHIMEKDSAGFLVLGSRCSVRTQNLEPRTNLSDIQSIKKVLYQKTKELGGILSGEHGIGLIKVNELPEFVGETQIELMRRIKEAFDPKGILNPGKMLKLT